MFAFQSVEVMSIFISRRGWFTCSASTKMASTLQLVLVLISLLAVIPQSRQLNCTDECCYWYTTVVNSTGCSVDSHPVHLTCEVIAPDDPLTNVTVRWYRSEDQETAGVRGTSLLELNITKYSLDYTIRNHPISTGSDLFRHFYTLEIVDFNTADFGYYWCQLVVNDSCLAPSPYRHIYEDTRAQLCSTTIVNLNVKTHCAGSDSSPGNCSVITRIVILADTETTVHPTSNPEAMHRKAYCNIFHHDRQCNGLVIGSSIGGLVLILLVMTVCTCFGICWRRRKRKSRGKKDEPADVELQNSLPAPMATENNHGTTTLTSQHEQVTAVIESGTVTNTANGATTTEESHTYDSVDLDTAHPTTTTPAPAPDPTTSHTYEATPGQQPTAKPPKTSQQTPSKPGFTSSVEYDEIDRDEAAQKSHLYSEVRENTVGSKTINHAEKPRALPSNINKVHQYDQVIRNQDTSNKQDTAQPSIIAVVNPHHEPVGPMYHVLEDSSQDQQAPIFDDQYSAPQTHQLVLPTTTGAVGSPDERGLIIAVGGDKLDTAADTTQMAAENEHREPQYDQPFLNPGGPPNKDSSTKKLSSSNPLFDDPSYECGYPDPNTTSKTPGPQLSASTTSKSTSSGAVPEPPPRLESSQGALRMNTYDDAVELMRSTSLLSKSSNTSRRQRDYEQTDLSKMRKRNTIGGSKLNGLFDDPSYEVAFARRAKKK